MKKILICPDTHVPFHDERAAEVFFKAGRWFKPDILVHIGDLLDCYAISSHSKDPRRANEFDREVEEGRKFRASLDKLGAERKVFCEGNHEDRLRRYLMEKAPELFSMVTTDKLLYLSENNWKVVPYQDSIKIGAVYYAHDTGSGGKYPTRLALETFQHSVVVGHNHRLELHVTGDATGGHQVGAQFGWLGDIESVDYMHRIRVKRMWSLGFGVGYMDERSGVTHLVPVPIVDYAATIAGREFTA